MTRCYTWATDAGLTERIVRFPCGQVRQHARAYPSVGGAATFVEVTCSDETTQSLTGARLAEVKPLGIEACGPVCMPLLTSVPGDTQADEDVLPVPITTACGCEPTEVDSHCRTCQELWAPRSKQVIRCVHGGARRYAYFTATPAERAAYNRCFRLRPNGVSRCQEEPQR